MNRQQIIEKAKSTLLELYRKYEGDGILSIYIWGSITRPDFDPETSDIDVICIVSDSFLLENNEKYKQELNNISPEREWGFQIIYFDELNGGQIRSRLATAMSPQSILHSYPSWVHVAGNDYAREDFAVKDASIEERMKLNIKEIQKRLANIPSDTDQRKIRDRKGVVKAGLLLIYNRQLNRNGYFDLDYNKLYPKADDIEAPVVNALLAIRQNEIYDGDGFNESIIPFIQFVEVVKNELAFD